MKIEYAPLKKWEVVGTSFAGFGYDVFWQGYARTYDEVRRKVYNLGMNPDYLSMHQVYEWTDCETWLRQFE